MMVELTASGDADQVEARLRQALDAHGLQLFAASTMRPAPAMPMSSWNPTSC
jgi:hypothetical protein